VVPPKPSRRCHAARRTRGRSAPRRKGNGRSGVVRRPVSVAFAVLVEKGCDSTESNKNKDIRIHDLNSSNDALKHEL
jgi:hypothetical protein